VRKPEKSAEVVIADASGPKKAQRASNSGAMRSAKMSVADDGERDGEEDEDEPMLAASEGVDDVDATAMPAMGQISEISSARERSGTDINK
jgi:hypothetical protein